jgi:hypothetical protein
MAHWHDFNPWANEVIYLASMEEYAHCHDNLNQFTLVLHTDGTQTRERLTSELIIELALNNAKIRQATNNPKVDAYILPQPSGYHSLGLRVGPEGSDYISPPCNQEIANLYIKKYGGKP